MATVSTIIGKSLLASALGDLYLFIKGSIYNSVLEQVLIELDIKGELDIVQALLYDLSNRTESRIIKVASDQVKNSVKDIHYELKLIQKELEYHKTRYFNSWRSPNYNDNLIRLKTFRDILRKRRELLISTAFLDNSEKNLKIEPKSFMDKILN